VAAFLGRLDKGLVIAANAIAHRDEVEVRRIENIPMLGSKFEKLLGQKIVVLFLLESVVES
jgi:hypothetical protein